MAITVYSMDEMQRLLREGGFPIKAPIISGSTDYGDTANTLTLLDVGHPLIFDPSTTRIQTLPTTGVLLGDIVRIVNIAAAQKITVESSDGDDILTFQNGSVDMMALQAAPTDRTHWRMMNNTGGASPYCWAFREAVLAAQDFTTATEIILDAEIKDNNSDFNISNGRFNPKITGTYRVSASARITLWAPDAGGALVFIRKNGLSSSGNNISGSIMLADSSSDDGYGNVSGILELDGINDYISLYIFVAVDTSVTVLTTAASTMLTANRIGD